MSYLDSRRFHLDRFVDLLGSGADGLSKRNRARLLFDHLMGVIWPMQGGRV